MELFGLYPAIDHAGTNMGYRRCFLRRHRLNLLTTACAPRGIGPGCPLYAQNPLGLDGDFCSSLLQGYRAMCIDPKISLPTIPLPRRVDFLPLLRLKLGSPVCAISDRFGSAARTLISVAGWKSFETS